MKRPLIPRAPVDRHCIFCGQRPREGSREHVLPQWLIRMTGDPKRRVVLGVNYHTARPVKAFAFDQFTFPACDQCNNVYSALESEAKPIIEKILQKEAVSELELDKCLDWLDKVRVGMWLGGRYMSGNFSWVDPLFHISTRVGKSDRAMFITHTDAVDGLSVMGCMSPMFSWMPSVFGLRINGTLILSASTDLMISENLGFPYASHRWATEGEEIGFDVVNGTEGLANIRFGSSYRLPAIKIFQPIYRKHLSATGKIRSAQYVAERSLDPLNGRGRTYVVTDLGSWWGGFAQADHLGAEFVVQTDLGANFGAAVLEAQNELIWTLASERKLPPSKRGRTRKFHFAYSRNQQDIALHLAGRAARSFADVDAINDRFERSAEAP